MKPIEVLMIEDSPSDIGLMEAALEDSKLAFNLKTIEDGDDAYTFLIEEVATGKCLMPDLILLDLNLPGMRGDEILSKIKQDDRLKPIPVVILTTSEASEDILRAYQNHVNCYIRKPIDFAAFTTVVEKLSDFWFTIVKLPKREND